MISKRISCIILNLLVCCALMSAQQVSEFQKRAEAAAEKKEVAPTRFYYIRAFEDYVNKDQMKQAVECGVKGAQLYYKENYWKEAFDLLHSIEEHVAAKGLSDVENASLYYYTAKEREKMYVKMGRPEVAKEHLDKMESFANLSNDEDVKNDLLYSKAIYYYTFGQNAKGNAVFREMANKLTAKKEYGKVEEVYKTLIANGRRSNSANLVAQSYSAYMAWKDSTSNIRHADEVKALKKQIADNEATISDQESSLTTRWAFIIGLLILAGGLAAALVLGGVVLMRFIVQTRKQKKQIELANDNNALKAKFISNISAQLEPTLQKLDSSKPEVQSLLDFSRHIQTLSEVENSKDEELEMEEVSLQPFCEQLMEQIRGQEQPEVTLKLNVPRMTASINKAYVTHILLHLLRNAAIYTPAEGTITLEYKKRGARTHQFLVTDTGCGIPEEQRENIFKPFLEIRDLTKGDGLGLPTCKQMALKMKGDLSIDPEYHKGTRFVLELHA